MTTGRRRWIWGLVLIALAGYGAIRWQIVQYDRRIREVQQTLDDLHPKVLEILKTKELQATLQAHRQFADAGKATVMDWVAVFQQLAAAMPPSLVLHTMNIEGSQVTLQGILRHVPPEPQAYLAGVAATLKTRGVLQDIVVTVTPPEADAPTVAQVELKGRLR